MTEMNPILARFQHTPSLVCESQLSWFQVCAEKVATQMSDIEGVESEVAADDFWAFPEDSFLAYLRPYKVKNGILQIPVRGILLNKFPYTLGGWATGYEYIWEAVKRGLDDGDVKGIALIVDSPGGLVAGNFELVEKIFERRGEKPIRAFADTHAYSAAYSIASVADSITVSRSGGVGSIGVIVTHMEMSKALENMGLTVTLIRSKPRKAEAGPYEQLTEKAQARIQSSVDYSHKEFVALVARNRGMTEAEVDATDALPFMPHEAVENGLADEIGALDDALTAFVAHIDSDEGEETMADNNKAETVTMTDHTAAVEAAEQKGKDAGMAEGASAERARINDIIGCDEGKTRPAAALSAALKTGMSVDEAKSFLAGLPEEKGATDEGTKDDAKGAGAPAGMLDAAMNGTANPEAGAGTDSGAGGGAEPSRAERTLALAKGPRKQQQ